MRNIALLFMLASLSYSVEISAPDDGTIIISFMAGIDGVVSLDVTANGEVHKTTAKYERTELRLDINVVKKFRDTVLKNVSKYAPNTTDVLGNGFNSIMVSIGSNGSSVMVNLSWNESRGVEMPESARLIVNAMKEILK